MSPEELAACYGKRAFRKGAAEIWARRTAGQAYQCRYCRWWHVGGSKRRGRRSR